jgi:hypothetical protein
MRQLSATQLRHGWPIRNADKPVLLDVREPWEFETCRIAGSLSMPMRGIPARYHELKRTPTSSWSATTAHAASRPACSWSKWGSPASSTCMAVLPPGRGMSIRKCQRIESSRGVFMMKTLPLILAGCFATGLAHGADLLGVYRDAVAYDAQFAAARAALAAGQEKLPQGRSGLLPTIGLSANSTWNDIDTTRRVNGAATTTTQYNSNGWTVQLTQPLFRWQNWVSYTQSELAVAQAEAQFVAARQDLIVRVAQAYFRRPAGAGHVGHGQGTESGDRRTA